MPRSQNKVASHRRRKKLLSRAKGYWGARSKVHTIAKHHVEKAGTHAYRHRRTKKREIRGLWITRISAAVRLHDLRYSEFLYGLKLANIEFAHADADLHNRPYGATPQSASRTSTISRYSARVAPRCNQGNKSLRGDREVAPALCFASVRVLLP